MNYLKNITRQRNVVELLYDKESIFMKRFVKTFILLICIMGMIALTKYLLTDEPYFETKYDDFLYADGEEIQIEEINPQSVLEAMSIHTMEWADIDEPYYIDIQIVDFEPYKYAMVYEPVDMEGYTGEMNVYCSRINNRMVFQFGEKRYAKAEKTVQTMSPIYVQRCYEQILEYMNKSEYSALKWFEIKMEKGNATVGWNNEDKTIREYIEFEIYEEDNDISVIFSNKQRKIL